jgi:hypothetical protein
MCFLWSFVNLVYRKEISLDGYLLEHRLLKIFSSIFYKSQEWFT